VLIPDLPPMLIAFDLHDLVAASREPHEPVDDLAPSRPEWSAPMPNVIGDDHAHTPCSAGLIRPHY
jgi:hypothetical protein